MTIKPLFVGPRALQALEQAGMPIRPISKGSWVISGSIGILAGSASLIAGVDTPYTWSDAGETQWRFFEIQRGTSIVLNVTSRAWMASTNKYYALNGSPQAIPSTPLANVPQWLQGLNIGMLHDETAFTNDMTTPYTRIQPQAMWWDTAGPALPQLTRFEEDVIYDLLTEATLNTGAPFPTWNSVAATTQPLVNEFSVFLNLAQGAASPGYVSWNVDAVVSPTGGGGPSILYYVIVLTQGIATTALDITNILPTNAGLRGVVLLGPFIASRDGSNRRTGVSFAGAFIPGIAPNGIIQLPYGADSLNTGILVLAPTGSATVCSAALFTWLGAPGQLLLNRQEQQAIGAAQRATN